MGAVSFVLQLIISIPLGIIAATKQYSKTDYTKVYYDGDEELEIIGVTTSCTPTN